MRAICGKRYYKVVVSFADIYDFNQEWPGSNLHGLDGVTFEFDGVNGDLVDIQYENGDSDDWDGEALLALSQDAQAYALKRPRCRRFRGNLPR